MNAPLVLGHPQAVKLTVDRYHQLDGSGAFAAYGGTELVDGTVYAVSPVHRPHGYVRDELAYRLRRALEALGSAYSVATETSVNLGGTSEPLPDIIVTNARRGEGAIPVESVALLVEVSTNTLAFDLGQKAELYAKAGVPEYWVIDVEGKRALLHMDPGADGYAEQIDVPFGECLIAGTIDRLNVETAGLA